MSEADARETTHRSTRPSRRRVLLAGAVAVVGAVVVGYVLWQNQHHGDTRTEIAAFTGDGDQVTESFTVEEGWQVHWENEGESFAFAITGDFDFGTVIDQNAPGSGIT